MELPEVKNVPVKMKRMMSSCPFCNAPARFDQGSMRHYQCGSLGNKVQGMYEKSCSLANKKRQMDIFKDT